MGRNDHFVPGSWNRIDDRTGFKIKAGQSQKEWTNSIVEDKYFERRNAQDLLRSKVDRQAIPDPRSESSATFVGTNEAHNALLDPDIGTASASAVPGGGNTGDGTFSGLVADLSAASSLTLTVTRVTRAAADDQDPGDNGEFTLADLTGQIGVFFAGAGLCFTLNEDGSTAFAVGDTFAITVT